MPLFRKSPLAPYAPKAIRLSDLYRYGAGRKDMSDSAKQQISSTLKKAGYHDEEISKIVGRNEELAVKKMKEIAGHLNQGRAPGFVKEPKKLIENFVRHESAKKRNIARIIGENAAEAQKENLALPRNQTPGSSDGSRKVNLPF